MSKSKKIILYYIDNDIKDIKKFKKQILQNPDIELKWTTSVQSFYNNLRNDINPKKITQIVIINSFIRSNGLNTHTALEIVPMIKGLNRNIEIIIFSDSDDFSINPTESKIRISSFIKKNEDFYLVLNAIIAKIIINIQYKKTEKIFNIIKFSLISILIFCITIICLMWLKIIV